MDPNELLSQVTGQLRALAQNAVEGLVRELPEEPSAAGTVLAGRLLAAYDRLPPGNSLVELVREMLGDLDAGSPVRLHGWRRAPGAPLGLALVLTDPSGAAAGRAVLGVTPGGPLFDVVVTPGAALSMPPKATGPWSAEATIAAPGGWDAAFGPGLPPTPPGGTATIRFQRTGRLAAGTADGPGISVNGIALTVTADPGTPPAVEVELRELEAAILPAALARLIGVGGSGPMAGGQGPVTVTVRADRAGGLRFAGTGALQAPLPLRLNAPGVQTRGLPWN